MSILVQLAIASLIFAAGAAGGIKWEVGIVAARDLAAQTARATDVKQQRQFNDRESGQHVDAVAALTDQLGDARAQIAQLSSRPCLAGGTVRMLNATGVLASRAPASQPASAPQAPAGPEGERYSTERDVAEFIAICRTRYGEVSDQLNKILDIEDRRYPPDTGPK